jgi:glycerol-3-phosphate dehydrogenase
MKRNLDALHSSFDLVILGGGITGAGVALDAALRGLRVALIDKGDFGGGTSSLSTKLVHGGVRYLETGQFALVYEALHERTRLLANAPHLVWPLRFVIPFYDRARVPAWKWRVGLMLYDLLAGRGNLLRSHLLSPRRAQESCPGLRRDGLRGAAAYADAQMDDARLCLEVIRSAVAEGAVVCNHVEAVALEREGVVVRKVRAIDRLTGREIAPRGEVIVNATGPWGDAVRTLAGEEGRPHLAPTKGVHLVAADRGLTAGALLLHPHDGRVFFALPWLGKTLVGTTDTDAPGPPDDLGVTEEDISYLLTGFNHHFDPPLERAAVLGTFAGVRPLLASRGGSK